MIEEKTSVLDASPLLAYLHDEPGAGLVEDALGAGAVMSSVNCAEVLSKLADNATQGPDDVLGKMREHELIGDLLTVSPLTVEDAEAIARLRSVTRGLSLADRAGLTLALRLGLPVFTADRAWQKLFLKVPIQLIR